MRTLLFHLALVDCWEAAWRGAAGDAAAAARFVIRAASYLETGARARDDKDEWTPVLGAPSSA